MKDFPRSSAKKEQDCWMIEQNLMPGPWSNTQRPSTKSSRLSRFTDKYDGEAIATVLGTLPTEARENVDLVLRASAEIEPHGTRRPLDMALGDNQVLVSCAGGFKETEALVYRFKIPERTRKEHLHVGIALLSRNTIRRITE